MASFEIPLVRRGQFSGGDDGESAVSGGDALALGSVVWNAGAFKSAGVTSAPTGARGLTLIMGRQGPVLP